MSSAVPSLPSGPGCTTGCMREHFAALGAAHAQRIVGEPTTVSLPGGSTISAFRSVTTRFEPAGATLPTISITLKNWFRKPMSPGIDDDAGDRRHEEVLSFDVRNLQREAEHAQVRDLRLHPLERVGDDRLQAWQTGRRPDTRQA